MNNLDTSTHNIDGYRISVRETALGYLAATEVDGRLATITQNYEDGEDVVRDLDGSSDRPQVIQALYKAIKERRSQAEKSKVGKRLVQKGGGGGEN